MKVLQRQASAISASALVLLLYLLATGVSEVFIRLGLPAQWRQSLSSAVLCAFGALLTGTHAHLFRSRPRGGILGAAAIGLSVAVLVQAIHFFALVANLTPKSGIEYGPLPPFEQISTELVLGAVSEELLFSVFLYAVFKQKMRIGLAVVLVALFFVAMHRPGGVVSALSHLLYIVSALALFERYRSVAINVSFHLVTNALTLVVVLRFADRPLIPSPLSSHAAAVAGCLFAVQILWVLRIGWHAANGGAVVIPGPLRPSGAE